MVFSYLLYIPRRTLDYMIPMCARVFSQGTQVDKHPVLLLADWHLIFNDR